MAAKSNLNPDQLRMFMTPEEIMDHVTTSGDRRDGESMSDMWARKVEESKQEHGTGHGSGVYDALSQGKDIIHGPNGKGKVPILHMGYGSLQSRQLENMHHRVAALADIDRRRGTKTFVNVDHSQPRTVKPTDTESRVYGPVHPDVFANLDKTTPNDSIFKYFL